MKIVQKYGGTSVADAERVRHVASRIAKRKQEGEEIIVVVSAMGNRTDELIDLALSVNPSPPQGSWIICYRLENRLQPRCLQWRWTLLGKMRLH